MQGLLDFLSFRFFISPFVLLAMYYTGALMMPLFSRAISHRLNRHFDFSAKESLKPPAWPEDQSAEGDPKQNKPKHPSRLSYRTKFCLLFFFSLLGMEILWRMLFEFLIAYLQIWNALQHLQGPL